MVPPTLILTTTVNVQNKIYLFQTDRNERIQVYVRKIIQWLEDTNFNVVVVENTGHTFDELAEEKVKYAHRFEVISYKENELKEAEFLNGNPFKGASEMFSIAYAYDKTKLKSDFIIKITGRFYIPDLENYLKRNLTENIDVLVQQKKNRCEMVGCHVRNFNSVFNIGLYNERGEYNGNVEDIYEYRCSLYEKENTLHCPTFYIQPTQRGGINEVFYNI